MSTNRAFLLFFVFVLSVTRSNGQFEMHPLLQSRDSVRAYRIRTIEIRSEAVNRKSQEYTYDRRGRLVRIIQYGPAGEPILEQRYAYRGRRATLHQTYVSGTSTQRTTYALRYDARGRLLAQSTRNGAGEEVATLYQYGANGLPVSRHSRYQGRTTDSTVYHYRGRCSPVRAAGRTGTRTSPTTDRAGCSPIPRPTR